MRTEVRGGVGVVAFIIIIITFSCCFQYTFGFQPPLSGGFGGPWSTSPSTLTEKLSPRRPSPILRSTSRDDDQGRPTEDLSSKFDVDISTNFGVDRRGFLTTAATTAAAAAAGTMLLSSTSTSEPANALTLTAATSSTVPLPWEASPVNKRSGVTVFDAEKSGGYNVAFVTYLSRFLLNFDTNCQKYWFSNVDFPKGSTAKEIEQIRLEQFAAFSASVEIGLIDYEGTDGPTQLLQDLVKKYGTMPSSTTTSSDEDNSKRRLAKSARRHIALLFGLLEKTQPTTEITKLLASVDNGSVSKVKLTNNETSGLILDGYELGRDDEPQVIFDPPQAGDDYEVAQGKALLKPTGGILRVDVVNGGSNYKTPPEITISSPSSAEGGGGDGTPAKVQAKISKGSIDSIKIVDPGTGYTLEDDIQITIASPGGGGERATAKAVLNMAIDRIEVTQGGSGYAVEKPLKVFVTPPSSSSKTTTTNKATKQKTTSDEQQQQQQGLLLAGYGFPIA